MLVFGTAYAGLHTIDWVFPDKNTDGTPLTEAELWATGIFVREWDTVTGEYDAWQLHSIIQAPEHSMILEMEDGVNFCVAAKVSSLPDYELSPMTNEVCISNECHP